MSKNSIIEIKNLTKTYGSKKALNNINLDIEAGKILGILGPNGSGKTTLIKIITGLIKEYTGDVFINGQKPGVYSKSIVSYLPDRSFLYEWMNIQDALDFYDDFYDDFNIIKAYKLLDFMNLDENMKISSLSKGMEEKLNLSLILSRKAKIYILDEPIAGVDPVGRDKIIDSIINNYIDGSTMIITTHLVKEMENIFDNVSFIDNGKIILTQNAEELREKENMQINDIYKKIYK